MKLSIIALVIVAALAAVAGSAFALILGRYAPDIPPIVLFMEMSPVLKLTAILIQLVTICIFLLGPVGLVIARASGSRPGIIEIMLGLAAAACTALAALAALYGEMNTQLAIKAVGPVDFAVTAAARAESLLVLTLGLASAALAMAFLTGVQALRLGAPPRIEPPATAS